MQCMGENSDLIEQLSADRAPEVQHGEKMRQQPNFLNIGCFCMRWFSAFSGVALMTLVEKEERMNKGMRRSDRLIQEKRHDVYQEKEKLPEPTLCTQCRAVFSNGRWSWEEPPKGANEAICPACRRILENLPAGYVEIRGQFFEEHQDEILNLARNIEKQERTERPLERIMTIKNEPDHTLLTTTGVNIARRIGEAISRSYSGDFSFQYADGEKSIRVYWERTQ